MEYKGYVANTSNLYVALRAMAVALVVVSGAAVYGIYRAETLADAQKTILVPSVLKESAWVGASSASIEYQRGMARTVGGLAFHYQPNLAKKQFEELLAMWAPETAVEAKERWQNEAETIHRQNITSVFFLNSVEASKDGTLLEISGLRRLYVDDAKLEDAQKTYLVEFRISEYRFQIINMTEK